MLRSGGGGGVNRCARVPQSYAGCTVSTRGAPCGRAARTVRALYAARAGRPSVVACGRRESWAERPWLCGGRGASCWEATSRNETWTSDERAGRGGRGRPHTVRARAPRGLALRRVGRWPSTESSTALARL